MLSRKEVERGNKRMKEFVVFVESQKLNLYKIYCLLWQRNTGKKCGNKKHAQDIYENKLECEASLTESVVLHMKFGSCRAKDFKTFISSLKEFAAANQ